MKIAVITCWKYRDAWKPFVALLDRFWPKHPMVTIVTDTCDDPRAIPDNCLLYYGKENWSWCEVLRNYTETQLASDSFLLFQEDFFIHSPVETQLIEHALTQMTERRAGAARLYPCPGADADYGDLYFGEVQHGSLYRVSCQATIWRPSYLYSLLTQFNGSPAQFEIEGSCVSERLADPILAFKRDAWPWPVQYLCSGITRGRWNPDSLVLFAKHGIPVDTTIREVAWV